MSPSLVFVTNEIKSHHLLVGDNTNKGEVKSGKSVKSLNPLNP
jgi:hypothetical protein